MTAYALIAGGTQRSLDLRDRGLAGGLTHLDFEPIQLTLIAGPGLEWVAAKSALLIGRLFERQSFNPVSDGAALDRAVAAGLEAIVRDYWGGYVLVVRSGDGAWALRDPSGALACYHGRVGGGTYLASDAGIARRLGLLEDARLDPVFLRHWLQYPFLRSARTGLRGVAELAPGASIALAGPCEERQLWVPSAHCAQSPLTIDEAAGELRRLVRRCVPNAAGNEPGILALSGGLDSSILAATLASAGKRPDAVCFAPLSPDGDERAYAAAVARHLGLKLWIARESEARSIPAAVPCFRPGANILLEGVDEAIEEIRLEAGATVKLDGGGGDSLFGFSATAGAVVDAGLAGCGWETIRSVAERSEASIWRVIWYALKKSVRREPLWSEDWSFLGRQALLEGFEAHPWMTGVALLPAGKREHVLALISIQHFLDRHSIGGIHRHPLLAQPLLEFCLSVPSWLWSAKGRDRAVARIAFAQMLPPAITARRTKGSLEGYFQRRFRALLPPLRELLLEGELCRDGVIDRNEIEAALASDETPSEVKMRLAEIATLERWLGTWRSAGAR